MRNCGDCIHKAVCYRYSYGLPENYADKCGDFQTQKSGKWVKIQSGDKDFPESIVCSRCGNENSHLDFNENAEPIGKVFRTSKYCPSCGARMVGGLSKNSQQKSCFRQDLNKERQTGEWIALENRFELGNRVKCSECGQVFVTGDSVSRKYCPNCGARMESEDKE